jgi:hypothetical protein
LRRRPNVKKTEYVTVNLTVRITDHAKMKRWARFRANGEWGCDIRDMSDSEIVQSFVDDNSRLELDKYGMQIEDSSAEAC